MKPLALTASLTFERAIGYGGHARYIGLYWSATDDDLSILDGASEWPGLWQGWIAFRYHPMMESELRNYDFGSHNRDAQHLLIVDRQTRALHVARRGDGQVFLAKHHSELTDSARPPARRRAVMSHAEAEQAARQLKIELDASPKR